MAYELPEQAIRAKPEVAESLFGSSKPQVAIDIINEFLRAYHGIVVGCDFSRSALGLLGFLRSLVVTESS